MKQFSVQPGNAYVPFGRGRSRDVRATAAEDGWRDSGNPPVSAAMYRLIAENTVDLIILFDAARRPVYVSPSAFEMLGVRPEEILAGRAFDLAHPDDRARVEGAFAELGPVQTRRALVFQARRKDGGHIWVEGQYRYLPEDGGVLAVIRDITSRKDAEDGLAETNVKLRAANAALQKLSRQDGLTGLVNRRGFDELLADEVRRARRLELMLSLVLLDVDCFKAYNDRYGHVAGDHCLRAICRAVEDVLQRAGDQAARYGGEEIVVLLPATDERGALHTAERIRHAVASLNIEHLGNPFGIATVSAGVASRMPLEHDDNGSDLIAAADAAMYRAKSEGKNRVRVAEGLQQISSPEYAVAAER
jgi:diguanylate cyclase (GGDEF)-like protein/PAS domain S-box-containing protein